MHTLVFFPWLTCRETLSVKEFSLIPYSRGHEPGGCGTAEQATLDALFEAYHGAGGHPIHAATIMQLHGHELDALLDEPGVHRALVYGELVTVSGLAARSYFEQFGYSNSGTFRCLVQQYDDPVFGVSVINRRRDGSSLAMFSRKNLRFRAPLHAATPSRPAVDRPFLQALTTRSSSTGWGRYMEAIQVFNSGSSDDPSVLQELELVFMVGAFERLYDLSRGKEDELAQHAAGALSSISPAQPSTSARVAESANPTKYQRHDSMAEVWIRDMFQLRGQHAHGKLESKQQTIWSLREHLLFASVAFPLAVKSELAAEGYYRLSKEDVIMRQAFEALLEPDHFADFEDGERPKWPWHSVIRRAASQVWAADLAISLQEND